MTGRVAHAGTLVSIALLALGCQPASDTSKSAELTVAVEQLAGRLDVLEKTLDQPVQIIDGQLLGEIQLTGGGSPICPGGFTFWNEEHSLLSLTGTQAQAEVACCAAIEATVAEQCQTFCRGVSPAACGPSSTADCSIDNHSLETVAEIPGGLTPPVLPPGGIFGPVDDTDDTIVIRAHAVDCSARAFCLCTPPG